MEQTQDLHVVFGSGVLGKNAARELVRMGKRVRVINRSGRAPGLPEQVELIKADAYDIAQARTLTQGATSIYQCAQPAYHEWEDKFPTLQSTILAAAMDNGAKLVVADNLYMYGDTDGQSMTETSPYKAHTRKGRVRAAMATAVQDAHAQGKVRATIARASDFFGPEDGALSPVVFGAAVSGKPVNLMGRLDQPHTFSYAPDFGRTLALLGTRDEALGEIWHVPSNAPMTQQAFINLVAEVVEKPVKTRIAGSMMLNLVGMFNPTVREMPEMLYEWQKPFVMDDSKIRNAFGLQPTPMRQAIGETVAWFRAQR